MTRTESENWREGKLALEGGYQMHYVDIGVGPVVLMLHGSGPGAGGRNNFDCNWTALVEAGYRVIMPDQLGFGFSSKPQDIGYDIGMFADTTLALLRHLGIERCAVIGNSLGGSIALHIAIEKPGIFTALVLMAPGGIEPQASYFEMPAMALMRDFYHGHVGASIEASMLQNVLVNMVYSPTDVLACDLEQRRAIFQTQNAAVMTTMCIPDRSEDLHRIAVPMLVLWGADDALMPVHGATKLGMRCPKCMAVVLSRCGHWVMMERADLFNRMCVAFLRAPEAFVPGPGLQYPAHRS